MKSCRCNWCRRRRGNGGGFSASPDSFVRRRTPRWRQSPVILPSLTSLFSSKISFMGSWKKKKSSEAANYSGDDPSDSCALKKSVISILDVCVDSLLSRRRGEEDRHGSGWCWLKVLRENSIFIRRIWKIERGKKVQLFSLKLQFVILFQLPGAQKCPSKMWARRRWHPAPPQGRSGSH